jgi:hypothetical protein
VVSQNASLKPHQNYCLNIIKKAISDDVGYIVNDSFHLWTDGYVDKRWNSFYITRTINDGLYSYIFWKIQNDSFAIYKETEVSKVGFVNDSLYDVNGDNYKDLVITDNTMNGQCQPQFSHLFCFDIDKGEFLAVEKISSLPNVTFQPTDKTVSGEWECKMTKDVYKFKWTNKFQLDTVYYKTINL